MSIAAPRRRCAGVRWMGARPLTSLRHASTGMLGQARSSIAEHPTTAGSCLRGLAFRSPVDLDRLVVIAARVASARAGPRGQRGVLDADVILPVCDVLVFPYTCAHRLDCTREGATRWVQAQRGARRDGASVRRGGNRQCGPRLWRQQRAAAVVRGSPSSSASTRPCVTMPTLSLANSSSVILSRSRIRALTLTTVSAGASTRRKGSPKLVMTEALGSW